MKQFIFIPLACMATLPIANQYNNFRKAAGDSIPVAAGKNKGLNISTQDEHGISKMPAVEFKTQEYCRTELKDFEFDARFSIVSATVYFAGTNFKNTEQGTITSSSLKPVKNLMERCAAGSIVIFDNVKVIGPDNEVRTIQGLTIRLF